MLSAIDRELKAVEAMLRGVRAGKLSASRSQREIDLKLRRLSFRLEVTPAIETALSNFSAAVVHYATKMESFLPPAQSQIELESVLGWLGLLRASLENATLPYATRNEAEEFAVRTRRNLEYIIKGKDSGALVHVVTQLTVSLLGLIVYPWEKGFAQTIQSLRLDALKKQGWPQWSISLGEEECLTLGQLAHKLRNVVAHRRVTFSSDSRDIEDVELEFEDQKWGAVAPHWRASISAVQLLSFCIKFTKFIEAEVG